MQLLGSSLSPKRDIVQPRCCLFPLELDLEEGNKKTIITLMTRCCLRLRLLLVNLSLEQLIYTFGQMCAKTRDSLINMH